MKNSLKIKVCGMLHPENIEQVSHLKPDFLGYIFYPGSERYVGEKPDPAIFLIPGRETEKVGIFVNEEIDRVKWSFEEYHLDMVQMHGEESPQYCLALSDSGIPVIKAFNPYAVKGGIILEEYIEGVRYYLFDTPGKTHGGTGRKFDWDQLEGLSFPHRFLLSGGIGPDDCGQIRNVGHKDLFGIDVNSKFERSPGMKDVSLLKKFIREVRE